MSDSVRYTMSLHIYSARVEQENAHLMKELEEIPGVVLLFDHDGSFNDSLTCSYLEVFGHLCPTGV